MFTDPTASDPHHPADAGTAAPGVSTPAAATAWLDLEATASRLGHYRWFEMRLFEILGGWVAVTPEPDVKRYFAEHSRHHGWHAELFEAALPAVPHLVPATLTRPAHSGLAALVDRLVALRGDEQTVERLTSFVRVVLPGLAAAYGAHAESANPIADAPVIRALRLVRRDDLEQRDAGERLLQRQIGTDDLARRVASCEAAIGGLLHPGPLPENA